MSQGKLFAQELKAGITAAEEAGRILLEGFYREDKGEERKGDIDPVTLYDRLSEETIAEILQENFPLDRIHGEEGGQRGSGERRWIIDPLDGTTNYSHGYPVWVVSIALEDAKGMAVGVVFDPCNREMFHTIRGQGAHLNCSPIHVSSRENIIDSLLCTGFPYSSEVMRHVNVRNMGKVLGKCMGVRRDGSAARDLAYVACGRLDGFWELGLKPWDTAAGSLLVKEAGGTVTGFHNKEFDVETGAVVATNTHIHKELLELVGDE